MKLRYQNPLLLKVIVQRNVFKTALKISMKERMLL